LPATTACSASDRSRRGGGWNWVGVVFRLLNPNDSGVDAPERRPRHDEFETIEIICLPDNIEMRMLAHKFKTHFTFEESALTGRLRARRPTAFSLTQGASGDVLDFCAALFDAQRQALHDAIHMRRTPPEGATALLD
jgi:hypothetical protein